MVNRWLDVSLVAAGVVIGVVVAGLAQWQGPVVSAQSEWHCRSWIQESKETADPVGPWLGTAARIEMAAAGLSVAGRYVLVACKQ